MNYLIRKQNFGRLRVVTLLPALRRRQPLTRPQKLVSPLAPTASADGGHADATVAAKRGELRDKALQASYDEYKELIAAWRNLDTKAQGNITVAGIFIAGIFTYLPKSVSGGLAEAVMLLLTLFFLVGCVLLSLGVLGVRDVPPHYLGAFMRWTVKNLKGKTDEEFLGFLPRFYEDHAELWHESYETFDKKNKQKGDLLWAAQILLIFAVLSAALLVAFKILMFKSSTPG